MMLRSYVETVAAAEWLTMPCHCGKACPAQVDVLNQKIYERLYNADGMPFHKLVENTRCQLCQHEQKRSCLIWLPPESTPEETRITAP